MKPKVTWSARSAAITYDASLQSKTPAVRKALLDGDWTFEKPAKPKASKKRKAR